MISWVSSVGEAGERVSGKEVIRRLGMLLKCLGAMLAQSSRIAREGSPLRSGVKVVMLAQCGGGDGILLLLEQSASRGTSRAVERELN